MVKIKTSSLLEDNSIKMSIGVCFLLLEPLISNRSQLFIAANKITYS